MDVEKIKRLVCILYTFCTERKYARNYACIYLYISSPEDISAYVDTESHPGNVSYTHKHTHARTHTSCAHGFANLYHLHLSHEHNIDRDAYSRHLNGRSPVRMMYITYACVCDLYVICGVCVCVIFVCIILYV